jgi:hypothetical protein
VPLFHHSFSLIVSRRFFLCLFCRLSDKPAVKLFEKADGDEEEEANKEDKNASRAALLIPSVQKLRSVTAPTAKELAKLANEVASAPHQYYSSSTPSTPSVNFFESVKIPDTSSSSSSTRSSLFSSISSSSSSKPFSSSSSLFGRGLIQADRERRLERRLDVVDLIAILHSEQLWTKSNFLYSILAKLGDFGRSE